MSTLRRMKLERLLNERSMRLARSTKKTMRPWRAALMGLLMGLVVTISGCVQTPVLPVAPEEVTVDASLMSPSNYTSQLLKVLSE